MQQKRVNTVKQGNHNENEVHAKNLSASWKKLIIYDDEQCPNDAGMSRCTRPESESVTLLNDRRMTHVTR